MSEKISIKSNKREAEIEVPIPEILQKKDLQELVESLGEEVVFKKVFDQLKIDFRAMVRGKMESQTDEEWNYDLRSIEAEDFSDWMPSSQRRKSKEEKASEYLKKLDPDSLRAALAQAGIDPDQLK